MFLIICLAGFAGLIVSAALIYLFYFKGKSIVLPYIIFFVCLVVFAGGTFLQINGGISFGGKSSEPPDLTGEWKQVNSNDDGSYQVATIGESTIEIYWYTESDETTALYWAGTFVAPETAEKTYSWDSENDTARTDTALFASADETKTFTYSKGQISYDATAFGMTQTIKLEKVDLSESGIESEGTD